MSRQQSTMTPVLVTLAVALGGLLVLSGCGGNSGENQLIRNFFQASRVGDRTTVGNIAMVAFDPQEDGIVSGFSIENVSEEQRRPLEVRELAAAVAEAEAAQEAHAAEMRAYQDENLEAIGRVIEAERAGEDVAARDREVQAAWTEWRDQAAEHSKALADAEAALAEESRVAERSTFDPTTPIDVRQHDGELITKEVTINADVERDGTSESRTMRITLQRVELGSGEDLTEGRWIITGIA